MTVQDAIERANSMRSGNSASDEMKIKWLTELDNVLYNDVVLTHEREMEKYNSEDYDANKKLIADEPYDVLYVYWLMAQIDLFSSELNKYNNSLMLFKNALGDYKAWYNRNFMPKAKKQIRLGIDGG